MQFDKIEHRNCFRLNDIIWQIGGYAWLRELVDRHEFEAGGPNKQYKRIYSFEGTNNYRKHFITLN